MEIDYTPYLNGDEWPSESMGHQVDTTTGEFTPVLEPVIDMVPQKAVAALHKLIRWAREREITVQGEEEMEQWVRNTTLGRLLARRALRINDFDLYTEHGINRNALSEMDAAKALVHALFDVADMDAMAAARLATDLSMAMHKYGYHLYKE